MLNVTVANQTKNDFDTSFPWREYISPNNQFSTSIIDERISSHREAFDKVMSGEKVNNQLSENN